MISSKLNESASQKLIFAILFGLVLLVYASTIYFPYQLLDENWLLRLGRPDMYSKVAYPSVTYLMGLVQGRPIFLLLIYTSRAFVYLFSPIITIQLLRFVAIVGLAFFSLQIYNIGKKIKLAYYFALPIALVAVTLPTFQIMVGNATWLVVPLLLSTWGFIICLNTIDKDFKNSKKRLFLAFILSGLTLATYQSIILVNFSLLLFVFLFGYVHYSAKSLLRLGFRVGLIVITSIIIYFCLWKLSCFLILGKVQEYRYAPQNVHLSNLIDHFNFFISYRLKQAFNLWSVDITTGLYQFFIFVVAAGLFIKAFSLPWKNTTNIKASLKMIFLFVAACITALLLSDIIVMGAPNKIYSFTTVLALSLTCYFIFMWALITVCEFVNTKISSRSYPLPITILSIVCFLTLLFAQYNLLVRVTLPNWLLSNLTEEAVKAASDNNKKISKIIIYQADRPLDNFYTSTPTNMLSEFYWFNFGSKFYAYWHLKNLFDQLKLPYTPEIIFIDKSKQLFFIKSHDAPQNGETLLLDFQKNSLRKSLVTQ